MSVSLIIKNHQEPRRVMICLPKASSLIDLYIVPDSNSNFVVFEAAQHVGTILALQ